MKPSDFPIDRRNGHLTDVGPRAEQRPAVYRYAGPPPAEAAVSPGYDSLLAYWHILLRHRKTLLSFALVRLLGALVISMIQTPIYRVRTSLEIQGSGFLESKNNSDSSGNYTNPESYVETQVKLLQSESLLEHVIDKLKLQAERPKGGWRAFTWRIHRMLQLSDP